MKLPSVFSSVFSSLSSYPQWFQHPQYHPPFLQLVSIKITLLISWLFTVVNFKLFLLASVIRLIMNNSCFLFQFLILNQKIIPAGFTCPQSGSKLMQSFCSSKHDTLLPSATSYYYHCSSTVGVPVIDLGNSGGTLTGVNDGTSPVINLPSPLPIGEFTVTTAFVSRCSVYIIIMLNWHCTLC